MNSATPRVRKTVYLIWLLLLFGTGVNAATIDTQPVNSSVCVNSTMTFVVVASGATAYQWEVNTGSGWSNVSNAGVYSGATTATLAITGATISLNTYQYRCVVTGTPNVTSNAVTLTVVALPTITGTTNGAVCAGNTGQVSATASSGASVKWYNASTAGTLLGTGSTLSIPSAASTATYYAEAFTGGGSGTLATAYNNDNGQRGIMFDVIPTSNITVTGFDANLYSGTTAEYQVYYKVGSFVGSVLTPGDWTPLDTVTALTSLGINVPTPMGFNISVPLMANQTYAFYITNTYGGGTSYTVGAGPGELLATNAYLSMYGGVGVSFPFLTAFNYRRFNGTIHYEESGCTSVSRSGATLTVNPNANITAQPSNSSITSGGNTSFSITATSATGYQWQVNSGSGWGNVTNGGIYSGAATGTLSLTNATATVNGNQYRCITTGTGGCNDTSNVATLSITGTPPSISSHPSNSIVCSGANTSFSVTASGTGLSYQWQVNSGSGWTNITNGGIYLGALTATLNIAPASQPQNSNQYRCVVTGSVAPPATSNAALLTVNVLPVVSSQPPNRIICSGQNTNFSVTAANATGYQWQVNSGSGWGNVSNGGIYSGASTATLTLTGATASVDGNQYRCIVSGSCPPNATSNAGTLTINTAPSILAQPPNRSICSGLNTTFTVTASNATGYQWQVNSGSFWSNVSNGGIYSGTSTATLTLTGATASVDGNQYRCMVSGSCLPNATSNAGGLTINSAPSVTGQPANSTIGAGSNTSFSVTATNATGYQWQVNSGSGWGNVTNGGVYSGATTATLTLTAAGASLNANQYRCIVSGSCTPNATSNAATLTVNSAPAITGQPSNSAICNNANTTFSVTANNATGYQWQVNGGSGWGNVTNGGVYSGATTATLTLTAATTAIDGNQYRCEVTGLTTPNATSNAATLTINLSPSITTQPSNSIICNGNNTTFTISATDATGYQWQVNSGSGWTNVSNGGIYTDATTSTLTLTAATATVNGYQYRCLASGGCSPAVTSNAATITINTAPSVTAQPTNSSICDGGNTTFNITATGTGLGYQWQVNDGSGWTNISNGGIYSGVATATLTLTAATTAVNSYQYRCVVNGACLPSATSNIATLTIDVAPAVTGNPSNSTVCDGGNTSFTVTATGTGLSYQWQVNSGSGWSNVSNGGIYSGVATNTLALTAATAAQNSYQYRCVVSGSCAPSATSNAATLNINSILTINTQPANSIICAGNNAMFNVVASASGLGYHWQVNSGSGWNNVSNGGIYSGATTATLTLTAATTAVSGYQYRCQLSSACTAPTNSNTATLTVNVAPAITTQPTNSTICLGSNTSFAITASGSGITYQWEVNSGSGWTNVNNGGIYTGATANTLSLTAPTTAVDGYQYRCIIGGSCVPGVTSAAATLAVNTAPAITSQPSNSIICSGSNTAFSITATGTNITYQWQVNSGAGWGNVTNTGIYTGTTTNTLDLTAPTTSVDGNQYRCLVNGVCPQNLTSSFATITVNVAPAITSQPTNSTICVGSNTSFAIAATGTSLSYQWQVNSGSGWNNVTNGGIYTGAATNTLNVTAPTIAVSTYQYRCVIGGTCVPGVTSSAVTLTVNSLPAITMQPSNSNICSGDNTSFSITATGTNIAYQWQVNSGAGWGNISNGGIYTGAATNKLNLTAATAAQTSYQYRCIVSGTCSPAATSGIATLIINTAPAINTQPSNKVICEGSNTTFAVVAVGAGLAHQWQVNDGSGWNNVNNTGIYTGATTATLSLAGATTVVNGYQYRCVIGGTCVPGITSSVAALTINTAPVITLQPAPATICSGNNISFTVAAMGTALTYQWQANSGSGWNNISNGGIYTGATAAILNLTGATTAVGGYQYRCVVSGTCAPAATSSPATLIINALPAIVSQPSASTICENTNTSFAVTATGTGLVYQWQLNDGSGWANVNNAGIYTGAATAMLSLTGADIAVNTYEYRCVVGGTCTPAVTSAAATLTIQTAPVITTHPVSATKCEGLAYSFSVTAIGTGLTNQWQVNSGAGWANISNGGVYTGATTNVLDLTNIPASYNSYQYRCIVNGACLPPATSTAATLTVNTNPAITVQPAASVVICSDDNATISLQATGTGLTYQWQVDVGLGWATLSSGGVYAGVTTNTLVLTNVPSSYNSYQYRCIVTGTCAAVSSAAATLTVQLRPAITANPVNKAVCDGTNNVLFTMDATGTALTYQWQVNKGAGWANIANNTTYSGVTAKQLQIAQAVYSMDGYQYRCVASGACTPSVTTATALFTVYPLKIPAISITASDTDICVGTSVTFSSAIVNGGTSPAYKWKVNGSVLGTGSSYTSTAFANNDVVVCELTSSYGCPTPPVVTSNSISMEVTLYSTPAITITSPTNGEGCEGFPVYFYSQIANGGNTPAYAWKVNGNAVGANVDTFASLLQNGDAITCILTSSLKCPLPKSVTSNTIVADILPITKATVGIAASPDEIICEDEQIIMYSWFTNGGTAPQYQWMLNGVDIPGETLATLNPTGLKDQDIVKLRFYSSARCVFPEESNDIVFDVEELKIPEVSVTVAPIGNNQVMFKATPKYEGAQPLYQWFRNGNVIPGAHSTEYITSDNEMYASFSVRLISSLECVSSKVAMSRSITTGIADKEQLLTQVNLYPNPNTGTFSIEAVCNVAGKKLADLQIVNSVGQLIYKEQAEVVNGKISHTIHMNNEPAAGVYMLWIVIDDQHTQKAFTVTR
jgi:hypothetical protein